MDGSNPGARMYTLTTSMSGKVVRAGAPVSAALALKAWFDDETTSYEVACKDAKGAGVTKAHLREVARKG